jgi:hypothetical protein
MSFPTIADVSVNWVPASCMPSPLSPQKRTVTEGKVVMRFRGAADWWSSVAIVLIQLPKNLSRKKASPDSLNKL